MTGTLLGASAVELGFDALTPDTSSYSARLNNELVNNFWLELLPALVAAAASLLGIVIGIGQLTSAARLRRRATFWSE